MSAIIIYSKVSVTFENQFLTALRLVGMRIGKRPRRSRIKDVFTVR